MVTGSFAKSGIVQGSLRCTVDGEMLPCTSDRFPVQGYSFIKKRGDSRGESLVIIENFCLGQTPVVQCERSDIPFIIKHHDVSIRQML